MFNLLWHVENNKRSWSKSKFLSNLRCDEKLLVKPVPNSMSHQVIRSHRNVWYMYGFHGMITAYCTTLAFANIILSLLYLILHERLYFIVSHQWEIYVTLDNELSIVN